MKIKFISSLAMSIFLPLMIYSSAQACYEDITVINNSGYIMRDVFVQGPWHRESANHDLENGASFNYHAEGSLFTCHGVYSLNMLLEPDSDPADFYGPDYTKNFDYEEDGFHVLTITNDCNKRDENGAHLCSIIETNLH